MAMQIKWRRFSFFTKESVCEDLTEELTGALTCAAASHGHMVLGDTRGYATFCDQDMQDLRPLRCYRGPLRKVALASLANTKRSVLITIGDDALHDNDDDDVTNGEVQGGNASASASASTMKVWVGEGSHATCVRVFDLSAHMGGGGGSSEYAEVTALAALYNATQIAVGFSNGLVLLFQGDLAKEGAKPRPPVVLQGEGAAVSVAEQAGSNAISSLDFCEHNVGQSDEKIVTLFVTTVDGSAAARSRTVSGGDAWDRAATAEAEPAHTSSNRSGGCLVAHRTKFPSNVPQPAPCVLDERGCEGKCAVLNGENEMVLGRRDGVYFFSTEDRGGAAGFEGWKQHLASLSNYLIVASLDPRSSRTAVHLYDLRNKFVAFHHLLPGPNAGLGQQGRGGGGGGSGEPATVTHVLCEWGMTYIFTSQNVVWRLREKDTASKLELLYSKFLYPVAINLAYSSGYDVAAVMDIYKMYGDHLHRKGDFDAATQQYCHTIGHVEPSYVIRRFLDAQRITNLTTYLECLHDKNSATADHTTLLLNCYTKLKDVAKLDAFIMSSVDRDGDDDAQQGETAPQATAPEAPQAAVGAEAAAVQSDYTATVNTASARRRGSLNVAVSGDSAAAGGTNGAKFDVETAIRVLRSAGYNDHALFLAREHSQHAWYLQIQLERTSPDYRDALKYIGGLAFADAEESLRKHGKTLVTHLPEETTGMLMKLCTGVAGNDDAAAEDAQRDLPKSAPENFIHLYVDHPQQLRLFLEHILHKEGTITTPVGNTLLELLLQEWNTEEPGDEGLKGEWASKRRQMEEEVMRLLLNPRAKYDINHALVLVQMHGFKQGQLCLYEKVRMSDMVLQHYMEVGDTRSMLRICRRDGGRSNPHLWTQVLTHISAAAARHLKQAEEDKGVGGNAKTAGGHGAGSRAGDDSDDSEGYDSEAEEVLLEIKEVLKCIEQDNILTPLKVLEILSSAGESSLPLSVVKEYVMNLVTEDQEVIAKNEREIESLRENTHNMRDEIDALRTTATVFQATKCNACKQQLELPAVHFMCRHSFHQHCIPENEDECLLCAPEHRKWEEIRHNQEEKADQHEQFFQKLEETTDGFSEVAEYFGKGVFSKQGRREGGV